MAAEFTLYNSFLQYANDGTIDLINDPVKVALVTSGYTPDVTHQVLADVMASPDPEVVAVASPDNGYHEGGETLAGKTLTHTESPVLATFDATNLTWTALTAVFRYGIMYSNVTVDGVVNPLIGYMLFNDAPDDITVSGVDWTIQWSSSGIITYAKV